MGQAISIVVHMRDLLRAADLVSRLSAFDASERISSIGALGQSQTRRRITDETTGPDRTPWPVNRTGAPILVRGGERPRASIAWTSAAASPAAPFVGVSSAEIAEITAVVTDLFGTVPS